MWNKSSIKNGGHCISNKQTKKVDCIAWTSHHCLKESSSVTVVEFKKWVSGLLYGFASLGEEWGRSNEEQ